MKKKKGIKEREKEKEKEKSYRWKKTGGSPEASGGGEKVVVVVVVAMVSCVAQWSNLRELHGRTKQQRKETREKRKREAKEAGRTFSTAKATRKNIEEKERIGPPLSHLILYYITYNTRIIFKKLQLQQHRLISTLVPEMIVWFSF